MCMCVCMRATQCNEGALTSLAYSDIRDTRDTRDARDECLKGWDAPVARKGEKGGPPCPSKAIAARNGHPGRWVGRQSVSEPMEEPQRRRRNIRDTRPMVIHDESDAIK